jgi:hypothetical protein
MIQILIGLIMPRTKKTESEALAPAEPKKRRTVAPKSSAVTHKHTTKKTLTPEVVAAPEVMAAPVRTIKVEEIAVLAYSYWEARGCQGGSPQEDWFRAEQELKSR